MALFLVGFWKTALILKGPDGFGPKKFSCPYLPGTGQPRLVGLPSDADLELDNE